MEHSQTEIRQPYSLPVTIDVPNYPRLAEMKTRLKGFTRAVSECESRLAVLAREHALLNQQAESANPDQQVFGRLAALKHEINQAESELAGAQSQAGRVEDEHRQWVEQYGWNLYRRRLLARELAETVGGGPQTQMTTTAFGESRPRTRLEILVDLQQTVQWLAIWTGDPDTSAELTKVQTQLTAAYQQSREG